MSLFKPTRKVEYSSDASVWNDVSDDVISFEIQLQEMKSGLSTFRVELASEKGKYSSIFPAIPEEKGLGYFWKFSVNGVVLLLGRAELISEEVSSAGEVVKIEGKCLGQELLYKYCAEKEYPILDPFTAAEIIYDQQTRVGWNDVVFHLPSPDETPTYSIRVDKYRYFCKDLIAELCEALDYEAIIDSRSKPAELLFFPKNDPNKRLNIVLKSILYSQDNNVVRASCSRDIYELKNVLILKDEEGFTGMVPADQDYLTASTTGWTAIEGEMEMDTSDYTLGGSSVKCKKLAGCPECELDLTEHFGGALNIDDIGAEYLYFDYKSNCDDEDHKIIFTLIDENGKEIYVELLQSEYSWKSLGITLDLSVWDGDVDEFVWKIAKMRWKTQRIAPPGAWGVLKIDALYFSAQTPPEFEKRDEDSIAKYGERKLLLEPPAKSHYMNLSQWGDLMLEKYSKPMRVLEIEALIDPAQVYLSGGVTAAPLFPGYSLQVEIPRWNIKKAVDGGVYWRASSVRWSYSTGGFICSLELVPCEAESSSEDYSKVSGVRLLDRRNIILGRLSRVLR